MRRVTFIMVVAVLTVYILVSLPFHSSSTSQVFQPESCKLSLLRQRELDLFRFVECHVLGHEKERLADGKNSNGRINTLSESVGLMMDYSIMKEKQDSFGKEYRFLKRKLLVDGRYIKWKTGDKVCCNAAIDDLRIIRALLDSHAESYKKQYFDMAGFIQEGIYNKQVVNGKLYEFYDWNSDRAKPVIPLCYIDIYTMDRLRVFNKNWLNVADRGLSIIKNGRMGENSPFFYKYYDYETGKYRADEELKKEGGICLTYTLYTVIHLSEVNEDTEFFTSWLRNEIRGERLYGWYNPQTLKPSDKLESTAVYALAAVYSWKVGDDDLYYKLIDRMFDFMVIDKNSPYYGGFGNKETGEFHSFDNLTALCALGIAQN